MLAYIRAQLRDPLFVRVCMFLWGAPFALLGALGAAHVRPSDGFEWFAFALLLCLIGLGGYLLYVAVLGSEAAVHKAAEFMHEGGELLGLVFALAVILLALPVTILLQAIRAREHGRR